MKIFKNNIVFVFIPIMLGFIHTNLSYAEKFPSKDIDIKQYECEQYLNKPLLKIMFGGLSDRVVSGVQTMVNANNNKCEQARIKYIEYWQDKISKQVDDFCNNIGGGIPDYSILDDEIFLVSIGLSLDGKKINFIPKDMQFFDDYNSLAILIMNLKSNKEGAKENISNYFYFTKHTVRVLESLKMYETIPILPESLTKDEREKSSCTEKSGKTLAPNKNLSDTAEDDISGDPFSTFMLGNNADPLSINDGYIPNFYQIPVFIMQPVNASTYKWQECGCGYIHNSVSESILSNVKGTVSDLKDTLSNTLGKIRDTMENNNVSDLKILDTLQRGWKYVRQNLFSSNTDLKTKIKNIIPTKEINKKVDDFKEKWNKFVADQITTNPDTIVNPYKKDIGDASEGKTVNINMDNTTQIKVEYKYMEPDMLSGYISTYMAEKENIRTENIYTSDAVEENKKQLKKYIDRLNYEYGIYRSMEWMWVSLDKLTKEGLNEMDKHTNDIDKSMKN